MMDSIERDAAASKCASSDDPRWKQQGDHRCVLGVPRDRM